MVGISTDAKGGYRRIEPLTAPGRRRRWSVEEKARVVAETLLPGARVCDVARRWQLCSQQIFTWRWEARISDGVAHPHNPAVSSFPAFMPIVSQADAVSEAPAVTSPPPSIEVKLAYPKRTFSVLSPNVSIFLPHRVASIFTVRRAAERCRCLPSL